MSRKLNLRDFKKEIRNITAETGRLKFDRFEFSEVSKGSFMAYYHTDSPNSSPCDFVISMDVSGEIFVWGNGKCEVPKGTYRDLDEFKAWSFQGAA